jgi:hypothetical protein
MPAHAGSTLRSFLRYHLSIGFDHIFLFFDDPCDPSLSLARAFPAEKVTVLVRSPGLEARLRRRCSLWATLGRFYAEEVQARQSIHAELAVQLALDPSSGAHNPDARADAGWACALASPLRWLAHLDSDELFYTARPSVKPHFAELERQGIEQLTYANHEGVPETVDVGDCFREVTLFRRHHLSVPLTEAAREAMQWWESLRDHGQYMLAYDNGKSACRLRPGVRPASVHTWRLGPEHASRSRTALIDPRSLDMSRCFPCEDPCVLHYVCCGFEWFWSKYEMLGNFPSSWFGGTLPIPACFHTQSRDVFCAGSRERARAFYKQQVLCSEDALDVAIVERQRKAGVLVRIDGPKRAIEALDRATAGGALRTDGTTVAVDADIENVSAAAAGRHSQARETKDSGERNRNSACLAPSGPRSAPPKAPPRTRTDGPGATVPAHTYERAWILSAAAREYLLPQKKAAETSI